jgi:tight adherence protein C
MLREQSMGLSSNESLNNLLTRAGSPALAAFVQAILQGEVLGVSIGRILRELAVDMRKRRRQAAEERAQKAPIKLLFPLVILILPAMFIVLLGPAVYAFIHQLSNGF